MPGVKNAEQTRQAILAAAFNEIHENGFQGARLDRLLPELGLTKGALYYHFPDKQSVLSAVIDEMLDPTQQIMWSQPLRESDDPIEGLKVSIRGMKEKHLERDENIERGCPVFNLIQEMSPIHEGVRQKLEQLVDSIRNSTIEALERGIAAGIVREDVRPDVVADFIMATKEGIMNYGKLTRSRQQIEDSFRCLEEYLDTLRKT